MIVLKRDTILARRISIGEIPGVYYGEYGAATYGGQTKMEKNQSVLIRLHVIDLCIDSIANKSSY